MFKIFPKKKMLNCLHVKKEETILTLKKKQKTKQNKTRKSASVVSSYKKVFFESPFKTVN